MRVSIAMATYNGEPYLTEQLESITSQSRLPDEVIICDDKSSDGTLEILSAYASNAPFDVKVFRNEQNLGYVANFERATLKCSGDIIFYADQDDRWHHDKLARLEQVFLGDADVMVAINDARLCDVDWNTKGMTQLGNLRRVGVSDSYYVMGCASAHRRTWSEAMLPLPPGLSHDFWINHTAHLIGAVKLIADVMQDYRRHETNASISPLSNVGGARSIDLLLGHGLGEANESYQRMINTLNLMGDRLGESMKRGLFTKNFIDHALEKLDARRCAFQNRLDICSKNRIFRLPGVTDMLLKGQYNHHLGLRSALKDLIRP